MVNVLQSGVGTLFKTTFSIIITLKVFVMITMMIMIQRPFNFHDHFDDYDGGQDHDHNIEGVCDDYYDDHDPKTIQFS